MHEVQLRSAIKHLTNVLHCTEFILFLDVQENSILYKEKL